MKSLFPREVMDIVHHEWNEVISETSGLTPSLVMTVIGAPCHWSGEVIILNQMRTIRKATETAIVSLFSVLVLVVFFQVIARYVFNQPPAWSEELARYLQVWVIFLASPLCIRKGSHLAVDYFSHRLGPGARHRLDILIGLLITFYVLVVTIFGIRLMVVGRFQVSPAMGLPMTAVYVVFPLSGALMFLESVLGTLHLIRRRGGGAT